MLIGGSSTISFTTRVTDCPIRAPGRRVGCWPRTVFSPRKRFSASARCPASSLPRVLSRLSLAIIMDAQAYDGFAQAYFARGIPNFIGAGWTVDDNCAEECAKWFYSQLMGLRSPHAPERAFAPTTIGEALKSARDQAFLLKPGSSSWGAYQPTAARATS